MKQNIIWAILVFNLLSCGGVHQHFGEGGGEGVEAKVESRAPEATTPNEKPSVQARIEKKTENRTDVESGRRVPESYFDYFGFSFDFAVKGTRLDIEESEKFEMAPSDWVEEEGRVVIRKRLEPEKSQDTYLTWNELGKDEEESISSVNYEVVSYSNENKKTESWETKPAILYPEERRWAVPLSNVFEKARKAIERGEALGLYLIMNLENGGRVELEIEFKVRLPSKSLRIVRAPIEYSIEFPGLGEIHSFTKMGLALYRESIRNESDDEIRLYFEPKGDLQILTGVDNDYYETQPNQKQVFRKIKRWASWGKFEIQQVEIRTRVLDAGAEYSYPRRVDVDHRPIALAPREQMEIRWIALPSDQTNRCVMPPERNEVVSWNYISDADAKRIRKTFKIVRKKAPKTHAEMAAKYGNPISQPVTYHHWPSYLGIQGKWTPKMKFEADGNATLEIEEKEIGELNVSLATGIFLAPSTPKFSCQGVF